MSFAKFVVYMVVLIALFVLLWTVIVPFVTNGDIRLV